MKLEEQRWKGENDRDVKIWNANGGVCESEIESESE